MCKHLTTIILLLFFILQNMVFATEEEITQTKKNNTPRYRNNTAQEDKGFNQKVQWRYKDGKTEEYSILSIIYQIISIYQSINKKDSVYIDEKYESGSDSELESDSDAENETDREVKNIEIIKKFKEELKIPKGYGKKIKIERTMKTGGGHITANRLVREIQDWYQLIRRTDTDALSSEEFDCLEGFINPKNKHIQKELIDLITTYDKRKPFSNKLLDDLLRNKEKKYLSFGEDKYRQKAYDDFIYNEHTRKEEIPKEETRKEDKEEHPNKKRKTNSDPISSVISEHSHTPSNEEPAQKSQKIQPI